MQVATIDSPEFGGWNKYHADGYLDEPPIELRLAVTISEEATYSFVDFEADDFYYNPERLGWDLRRQHGGPDGAGYDVFATLFAASGGRSRNPEGYCEHAWEAFDRPRVASDRLLIDVMDDAIACGWEAPPEIALEIDKLRDVQSDRSARREAECKAGIVECNQVFGEIVQAEFDAAQRIARSNPQWWTTPAGAEEWADSVPAIQKVIETEALPPMNIVVGFTRLIGELAAADEQEAAHSDMMESVSAGALTLTQNVERGCADMANMTDYVRDAKSGLPEATNPDNVYFLLRSIGCTVRFNAWLERMEIKGVSSFAEPHLRWPEWTYVDDTIIAMLRTFAHRTRSRFCPGKDFFWDTTLTLAMKNTVDPAIDMLAKLESEWNGTKRLDSWLSVACSVPADAYHAAVGRSIVGGMVKRMRKPGAKHDEVALLVGPEGTGKSSLIAALAPRPEWFTESIRLGDEPKELVLSLAGKAIAEISEMSASTKDVAAIKAMVSRTTDAGRTAYARSVTERPRRNVFAATSNDDQALTSDQGNRRFLPVRIEEAVNLTWLRENAPQLIGEAAALESEGETFGLPRAVWGDAGERQEASRQVAEYELHLAEWFAETPLAVYVTAADLSDLVKSAAGRSVNAKAYTKIMRKLGFTSGKHRTGGKPVSVWHRGALTVATRLTTQQVGTRTVPRIGQLPMPAGFAVMPPLPA